MIVNPTDGLSVTFDSLLDEIRNAGTRAEMQRIVYRADALFLSNKLIVPRDGWQEMTRIIGLKSACFNL